MLFRGIVKKYTADLTLLTKFVHNIEVPVSLMEFLLQTQGTFDGFFLFEILHFMMVFKRIGLSKLFRLIFS